MSNKPIIVIPAYQPTETLLTLIEKLSQADASQPIVVVNDGSKGAESIFAKLSGFPQVTVLQHAVNLGKGQALKTAFNYCLLTYGQTGIVTADADGQHTVKDIQTILNQLQTFPTILWLGSRTLNTHVPLRSRFGNSLTRKIFRLIMGKSIYDTQTGLRGIPGELLPDLLRIPSSRYEYELDMLMHAIEKKVEIREVPIETIYLDGNKSSHFNPIVDSLRIYFVFIRYIAASISSACIDFLSFAFFYIASHKIFLSLVGARILSGTFNFFLCKKVIFKSGKNATFEAIKYIMLAVFSITLSYILVKGLANNYGVNLYLSKILADICVFLINFTIQKVIIFPASAVRE